MKLALALVFALGCSSSPASSTGDPGPAAEVEPTAEPSPAAPLSPVADDARVPAAKAAAPAPWRWIEPASDALAAPAELAAPGGRFRFVARPAPRIEHVDAAGKTRWSRALDGEHRGRAALASHGDLLLVAHHDAMATGATLYALRHDTGAVAWRLDLHAMGPIRHSRYRNQVQLRVDGDRAIVYGVETRGRYVEVVDLSTGTTVANTRPDEALATLPWRWHGPDAAPDAPYVYTPQASKTEASIAKRDAWTQRFEGRGSCGDAAVLEHAGAVHVAQHCTMASGAELFAFDATTGSPRFHVALEGLGPIGHSKYGNDVELGVTGDAIVVYGKESAGRYLEARDGDTGALLSSQVFRRW